MNEKNLKKTKELIKYMTTEELQQKLSDHNTDVYSEEVFGIIKAELDARCRAKGKTNPKKRNGFKEVLFVIVLIALILSATNPSKADYAKYLAEQDAKLQIAEETVTSANYLILSVFAADSGGEKIRAVGILNKFILLD